MSNALLQTHFRNVLKELGYPSDLEIAYSLNSCQGDGVAFYGQIDDIGCLRTLLYRLQGYGADNAFNRVRTLLRSRDMERLLFLLEDGFDLSINRNSLGNHYSHFNTMDLDSETYVDSILQAEDDLEDFGIEGMDQDMADRLDDLWEDFKKDLEEDIKDTSKRLESEGYDLIWAGVLEEEVVWERTTRNYIVRVIEEPDDDFDTDLWDEDLCKDVIQSMIAGKRRYLALRVEILDADTEDELAGASLCGIVIDKNDKTYGGCKRELLREAVDDLKDSLEATKKAA